jgi:hypothetical protein
MTVIFHNLDAVPFQIYVAGKEFRGTVTPTGHILPDGIPSAFTVRIPGRRTVTISRQKDGWFMPGPEDLTIELGVWIELHYMNMPGKHLF